MPVAIQIIHGYETFDVRSGGAERAGTMRLYCFYRKKADSEDLDFQAACADRHSGCMRIGRSEMHPASTHNRNHGSWNIGRYQCDEGSFVRLFITKKRSGQLAPEKWQVVLYMRDRAASRRLRVPFLANPIASLSCGYIEGKFDVLHYMQLRGLKYVIPSEQTDDYQIGDYSDLFSETILENESSPLILPNYKTVTTDSGREIKIQRNLPKRKISLK